MHLQISLFQPWLDPACALIFYDLAPPGGQHDTYLVSVLLLLYVSQSACTGLWGW
jgi:hypothetical protein